MLQIKIADALKNLNQDFPLAGEVILDPADIGADIVSASPMTVEGAYSGITSDAVHFEGNIRGELTVVCGKCLEKTAYPVDVPFEEIVVRMGSEEENTDSDEVERFTFQGDTAELDEMVRTLVLLSLPIRYICLQGCRQESIQEMDAAAAKAAKEESPFAVLLEKMEEV